MRTNAQTALSSFVVPAFDVVRPDPEDEWIQDLARKYDRSPDDVADLAEYVAHTITIKTGEQAVMPLVLECMEEKLSEVIAQQRARANARKEQMRRKGRKGRR